MKQILHKKWKYSLHSIYTNNTFNNLCRKIAHVCGHTLMTLLTYRNGFRQICSNILK